MGRPEMITTSPRPPPPAAAAAASHGLGQEAAGSFHIGPMSSSSTPQNQAEEELIRTLEDLGEDQLGPPSYEQSTDSILGDEGDETWNRMVNKEDSGDMGVHMGLTRRYTGPFVVERIARRCASEHSGFGSGLSCGIDASGESQALGRRIREQEQAEGSKTFGQDGKSPIPIPSRQSSRPLPRAPILRSDSQSSRLSDLSSNHITASISSPSLDLSSPPLDHSPGSSNTHHPPSYDSHLAQSPPETSSKSPLETAVGMSLPPTDLSLIDYGSQYVPHANSAITCTLALPEDLVLFGTTNGLRVLVERDSGVSKGVWTGLPIWDLKVLKYERGQGNNLKGSVLVLCGGSEDGSNARPRKDSEARVWKLESLFHLAQWAMTLEDSDAIDLSPKSGKGKGKALPFRGMSFAGSSSSSKAPHRTSREPKRSEMAHRWAADFTLLPTGTGPSTILAIASHITGTEMSLALATPNSIVLHQGQVTSTGSFAFSPAKIFYIPFSPTAISLIDLEIVGSISDTLNDASSSLFEWDDAASEMSLGEGVVGGTLGLFVTFSGARGCVIRTSDSGVVELKKGGRGEWMPVIKVKLPTGEVNVFTRGTSSFLFTAPLTVPLAMQVPITEMTWPELPVSIHAMSNMGSGLRLIGLTAAGTIHVMDVNATERGLEKRWTSVRGALGDKPRFLPSRNAGDRHVHVGYRGTEGWRLIKLRV